MIELPGRARLLLETAHAARIRRERLGDHLDRDVARRAAHRGRGRPRPCRRRRASRRSHKDRSRVRPRCAWSGPRSSCGLAPACRSTSTPRVWNVTSSDPMRIASPSASGTGAVDALAAAKGAVLAAEILEHRAFGASRRAARDGAKRSTLSSLISTSGSRPITCSRWTEESAACPTRASTPGRSARRRGGRQVVASRAKRIAEAVRRPDVTAARERGHRAPRESPRRDSRDWLRRRRCPARGAAAGHALESAFGRSATSVASSSNAFGER